MFALNPAVVNRFANARIHGQEDEQFEAMMGNMNNSFLKENSNNQQNRFGNCLNEIVDIPDNTTGVNVMGDRDKYANEMTNNMNTNVVQQVNSHPSHTQERFQNQNAPVEDFREQYTSIQPVCKQMCQPIKKSFLEGSFVISNRTLLYVIIALLIILAFFITMGIMCHKNTVLRNKVDDLEIKLIGGNRQQNQPQPIIVTTPYVNNQSDNDIRNQPLNVEQYPAHNRMSISPMAPVRNTVL